MTFPVYMLAISPPDKVRALLKSIGPGCRPQMRRPPSITAAVGEPGMPRVIIGSSADTPAAWAAVWSEHAFQHTQCQTFLGFSRIFGQCRNS